MSIFIKYYNRLLGLDIKKLGLYVLVFLCVFIPFRYPLSDYTTKYIKLLPDILILVLAVIYSLKHKFRYAFKVYDILFGLFLVWAFISTVIINNNGIYKFIYEFRSISVYYILFFILRNYNFDSNDYKKLIHALNIVVTALFILSLIEKIGNKEILFPAHIANSITYADNYSRVYSMLYNPNTYGAFLVVVFLFNIYSVRILNNISYYIYPILLTSLLLTQSRSSYIALFAVLVILLITWFINKSLRVIKWKSILLIILPLILLSFALYKGTIFASRLYINHRTSTTESDNPLKDNITNPNIADQTVVDRITDINKIISDSKIDGRIFTVITGLKILNNYPIFGTGFGSYGSAASLESIPLIYNQYGLWEGFYADNQYIAISVETGIIGSVLFITFLFAGIITYYKDKFKLIMCILVAIFGLFYNVFEVQIISMLFWTSLLFNFKGDLSEYKVHSSSEKLINSELLNI